MRRLKVAAYAIARNEEEHVDRWMNAVQEADSVTVLDTGSTDNTMAMLRARGARVFKMAPGNFRFDLARNLAIRHIPKDTDVCISSDLDEVLSPGWSDCIRLQWQPGFSRGRHLFTFSFNADSSPSVQYWHQRTHTPGGCSWKYPAHECLAYTGAEPQEEIYIHGFVSDHHPSAKDRSNYLALLVMGVVENPLEPRCLHYLGREFMFAGRYADAIATFEKYLSLPVFKTAEELSAAHRFIARCYTATGNMDNARRACFAAIGQTPDQREPYVEMADVEYAAQNFEAIRYWLQQAIQRMTRSALFPGESRAWNETPYDRLALASYYTGRYEDARRYSEQALAINPNDERLRQNQTWYLKTP